MESNFWQQSPVLDDILDHGHRYHFHQLMRLLEQSVPRDISDALDRRIRLRPDTSLAFPASDVRAVKRMPGQRFEVICRFMGLYGVDSPLPQYFLDDVTLGDEAGQRLQAFLDIFNHRLYQLFHEAWKKQNPFTQSGAQGLYHRLVSGLTGQYWSQDRAAMAFAGGLLGTARSAASLEEVLQQALSMDELTIDDERVTWIGIEEGLCLNGQQALGQDTCLGDALPVMGKHVSVNIGPVEQEVAESLQPNADVGQQMAQLLSTFLPEGVDFDVSIQLTPRIRQEWRLGTEDSRLGVHTLLGESSGRGLQFTLNSDHYQSSQAAADAPSQTGNTQ